MQIIENAILAPHNTFGVATRCRYLVRLQRVDDIMALLADSRFSGLPRLFLGGGSNILFRSDYYPGVIALVELYGIEPAASDTRYRYLRAAAGENWHRLVLHSLDHDYAGLENLALIPGTVGAAPIQNIGAYGVELSDRFAYLNAVDLERGTTVEFDHDACRFGYRNSLFKTATGRRFLITSVTLKLPHHPEFVTHYSGIEQQLNRNRHTEITARRIAAAVCRLRRSKLPNPRRLGNAGSFFKNPQLSHARFNQLRERHPDLPGHRQPNDTVKVSAAWLIERCGWRGHRSGDAGVYDKHALVLVNHGNASGQALWQLATAIMASVEQTFAIRLEPEPIIV